MSASKFLVSAELLAHALYLPKGVSITGAAYVVHPAGGPAVMFEVAGEGVPLSEFCTVEFQHQPPIVCLGFKAIEQEIDP